MTGRWRTSNRYADGDISAERKTYVNMTARIYHVYGSSNWGLYWTYAGQMAVGHEQTSYYASRIGAREAADRHAERMGFNQGALH